MARALLSYFLRAAQVNASEPSRSQPATKLRKKGNGIVSKIREIVSDEYFGEYVWAVVPVIAIVLGAIAFAAIAWVRAS